MTDQAAPPRSKNRLNDSEDDVLARIEAFRRRRPRLIDEFVTLAHGAGGKASAALVDAVFFEAFGSPTPSDPGDAAVLEVPAGRLAFTTDSYVVNPIRFPGGSIGDLAVNGTVNDLAVTGAVPRWITAAFVIEEGLSIDVLREVAADMRRAADAAGVAIVAGDGWHPGVIGIVAGRIKERFHRPVFVVAADSTTGIGKGSGRSVPGVDLGSAVTAARQAGLLVNGGGHAMAAGLTVEVAQLVDLHAFLAERIVAGLREAGSPLTLQDLRHTAA
ncbi:AIR synthase related protein, partial [uncultured Microbacterium sp.]|uniref:DHHA1 domain-containing protein n=1 Tax=uncultured Microbacterium sp. TaxID=191216 RepID=UPI0025896BE4